MLLMWALNPAVSHIYPRVGVMFQVFLEEQKKKKKTDDGEIERRESEKERDGMRVR